MIKPSLFQLYESILKNFCLFVFFFFFKKETKIFLKSILIKKKFDFFLRKKIVYFCLKLIAGDKFYMQKSHPTFLEAFHENEEKSSIFFRIEIIFKFYFTFNLSFIMCSSFFMLSIYM